MIFEESFQKVLSAFHEQDLVFPLFLVISCELCIQNQGFW